jgi:hypothetical protein
MDVTGNFGGESIRLRGMALEDTQRDVLDKISHLVEINDKMAKAQGVDTAGATSSLGKFAKSLGGAGDSASTAMSGTASSFDKITSILDKGVNKAFSILNEAVGASIRTIRGMDSNVDDAGFAIRSLSQNFRGAAGDVARFAADSVSQLQDQYRSFKQMGDIGGVLSSQFENLRITTSSMGLTMDQYAGLMQENFINLRSGGNLATKSMQNLQKAVNNISEDDELGYLFNRLGINVNDYAKTVLQMTALNRGLNKDSVNSTENFNKSIMKAVTTSVQLADAFGVQRSQMMQAQKAAQEDVLFERLFKQLDMPNDVKEKVLQGFLGVTGGDQKKAMQLMVGSMTGLATEAYADYQAAGFGPVITQMVKDAKGMQDGTVDIKDFIGNIQSGTREFANTFGDQANVMRLMIAGETRGAQAQINILDLDRRITKEGVNFVLDAQRGAAEAAAGRKTEIDILNDVQKQNISMAVSAANANKGLNAFGLTLAHSTQILTKIMTDIASGTVGTMANDPMVKTMISELNSSIKTLVNDSSVIGNTAENITKQILDGVRQAQEAPNTSENRTNTSSASPASATTMAGTPLANMIKVKTGLPGGDQMMAAGDIDSIKGQHNKGGATSPAIKQLLGVLAGSSESPLRVTGINDAFAGRGANSAHNQGLAVDFTITGDPAKKRQEIVNHLSNVYGLNPGGDFKVFDEYNDPFKHTQGGHLHLEFSKEGAAKFQSRYQGLQGAFGPGGNTSSAPKASSVSSAPAATSNTSSSPVSQGQDFVATVSNAMTTSANSVNTATNTVVLADSSITDRLDQMVRTQQSTNTVLSDLKNMMYQGNFG